LPCFDLVLTNLSKKRTYAIPYLSVLSLSQSCLVRKAGEREGEVGFCRCCGSFWVGRSTFGGGTEGAGAGAGMGGGVVDFGVDRGAEVVGARSPSLAEKDLWLELGPVLR